MNFHQNCIFCTIDSFIIIFSLEYKNTCLGKITMHKYTSVDATPEWFNTVSYDLLESEVVLS